VRGPGVRSEPTYRSWACAKTAAENKGANGIRSVIISGGKISMMFLSSKKVVLLTLPSKQVPIDKVRMKFGHPATAAPC
jgi:hypothetical protein